MDFCLARHATEPHYFGDGVHKYYLEKRCSQPKHPDKDLCLGCMIRTSYQQRSRTFPHGKVNEWIPAASHIYGGAWFAEGVKKWGPPPEADLYVAEEYQREAREGFHVPPQWKSLNAAPLEAAEMPKKAKPPTIEEAAVAEVKEAKPKAPPRPRKKAVPVQPIAAPLPTVHRDILLPTHLEVQERFDADGWEVEVVTLSRFEHENTPYFRTKNNKLYRQLRGDKIGDFVGRYDPMTDRICRDVVDSDAE